MTHRRDTVLVPLGGHAEDAGALLAERLGTHDIAVVGPRDLRRTPRCRRLAVSGQPPEDEIGAALVALGLARGRPEVVTLVDPVARAIRSQTVRRYVAGFAPRASSQLLVSSAAVALQRSLASLQLRAPSRAVSRPLGRVLYLRPFVGLPETVGGSITHARGVIGGLRELGVDVRPFTTDASIVEAATEDGAPVPEWRLVRSRRAFRAIPASAAFGGDLALAAAALDEARRADLIYQRHSRFSLVGPLLARLAGRPLFLEFNHSEAYFARWMPTPLISQLARCEQAALGAATRILVSSDVHRRQLVADGVSPGRIVVNPNGVDVSRFGAGGGERVRAELGVAPSELVVGFVGSFGPWHGAPVLARAFAELNGHAAARLLLVGAGPEQPAVRALLRERGAEARAILTGRVPPGDVPGYLDACDVLVAPHVELPDGVEFFGSPTKLFEYMAAGKAIVASRLGQLADVLDHERSALFVTPGDPGEIAAAIDRLARDPALRASLGAAARREAAAHHTWRANAERVVAAYAALGSGAS